MTRQHQRRKYDEAKRGAKASVLWYKSKAWKIRRRDQLAQNPTCHMCDDEGITRIATVVDHEPRHAEDYQQFFFGPIFSLCAHHHNSTKQAEEVRGFSLKVDDSGWPTDPRHPSVSGAPLPKNRNQR